MQNKIRILDKKTINKIAAGEVVERPASVVKELLENSIDANSTKIVIELERAGRKLIRVTDNGDGISPDDLKIAFEKHSTSKISNIQDVYNLFTLGFRGEALASIAAVARVECITCDGKHMPGNRMLIEDGEVRTPSEIGCAKGTTIKVKDLFYNLPARYKYLKTDQTELAHIIDVVTHLAIFHHKISFKVIHNSNELLNFPGTRNQIDNLVNIYGKELVRNLIPIINESALDEIVEQEPSHSEPHQQPDKISISGYIGKPSITRSDSSYQSFFVNGRHVETKVISNAVKDAYHTLVMKHRYPFVILFFNIDPGAIDVNISPTKLQIRFEHEGTIHNRIYRLLQDTLRNHDLIPEIKATSKPEPVILKAITTFGTGQPGYLTSKSITRGQHSSTQIEEPTPQQFAIDSIIRQSILKTESTLDSSLLAGTTSEAINTRISKSTENSVPSFQGIGNSTLPFIQPIGQLVDTYILAQSGDNLLIIDQHAAHERIMYEKIKQRYSTETMSTQELLEPVALELSPKELGLLRTNIETLRDLKFLIDELGSNSYYVKGVPIILGRLQDPEIIHDIINDLIHLTQEKKPEIIKDKMLQVMACKAALKAGKPLSIPEIQQLLLELYNIKNPYTCAHGRPTIISLTEKQLKKMFKRIV